VTVVKPELVETIRRLVLYLIRKSFTRDTDNVIW